MRLDWSLHPWSQLTPRQGSTACTACARGRFVMLRPCKGHRHPGQSPGMRACREILDVSMCARFGCAGSVWNSRHLQHFHYVIIFAGLWIQSGQTTKYLRVLRGNYFSVSRPQISWPTQWLRMCISTIRKSWLSWCTNQDRDSPKHFDICEKLQKLLSKAANAAKKAANAAKRKLQMLQSCFEHFQEAAAKAAGCLPSGTQWKDSFRVRGSARWQETLATCGLDSLKGRV